MLGEPLCGIQLVAGSRNYNSCVLARQISDNITMTITANKGLIDLVYRLAGRSVAEGPSVDQSGAGRCLAGLGGVIESRPGLGHTADMGQRPQTSAMHWSASDSTQARGKNLV